MSKPKSIYLVAQYYIKPKDHVNTSVKGWMEDPNNIRYDEKVNIVRGLKPKDMNAQIILDLHLMKVEKNSFNTEKTFDEIFRYFFENYSQYITTVMAQLNPEYLTKLIDTMQAEIDATPVLDVPAEIVDEEAQVK